MKVIMLMFDSLNRRMLAPYGCKDTVTPNFDRLAAHTVLFENSYAGSLPCMPARRELHTGRYNFLHRSWGPIEPFDDSMPEILARNGVYTHMISDHQHYWEDGGATYHHRYTTWEAVRGQEGDRWKADTDFAPRKKWEKEHTTPQTPIHMHNPLGVQDQVNRTYITCEQQQPQTEVFRLGFEFLDKNRDKDDWFLHLETFDPHEPFYVFEQYDRLYPHRYSGPATDWPPYDKVTQDAQTVEHLRAKYKALLTMCDRNLGRLLDYMDAHDMWKDTMLIVNTDHGFLLGEHDCWAKIVHPFYDEIAHTPLFVWDPRLGLQGRRRSSLVQTIDIPATILEFFGKPLPEDMQGVPLKTVMQDDTPVRQGALFGIHGGQVNVTDGRYVYMRDFAGENAPLYDYTLMPTHMRSLFSVKELRTAVLAPPFSFTKQCPVLRVDVGANCNRRADPTEFGTRLFDLQTDPLQLHPIHDEAVEQRMKDLLISLMHSNDAPAEQYTRLGLL